MIEQIVQGLDFMLTQTILLIFTIITTMAIHELGHYKAAKKIDPNTKIVFSDGKLRTEWFVRTTNKQERGILLTGVLFGFLVICCAAIVSPYMLISFIVYGIGIHKDLKRLEVLGKAI